MSVMSDLIRRAAGRGPAPAPAKPAGLTEAQERRAVELAEQMPGASVRECLDLVVAHKPPPPPPPAHAGAGTGNKLPVDVGELFNRAVRRAADHG